MNRAEPHGTRGPNERATSAPIFDGGRLNANLHGARAASNTLIEQYDQAVLDAVRDVAQGGGYRNDDLPSAQAEVPAAKVR